MRGIIANYRGSKRTQYKSQIIVIPEGITKRENAKKLLGKRVEWISKTGKKISGKISRVHGNKGAVIVKFERGLPGQALTTNVEIFDN